MSSTSNCTNLTAAQLKSIMAGARQNDIDRYLPFLNKVMSDFGINTLERQQAFIAQIAHESKQLRDIEEDLFYRTPGRLQETFGKKLFPTLKSEELYLKNPEKLANYVYANKIGNGSVKSGDGYRYRGRGLIQLTGRANYREAGTALGLDLENNPDLVFNPEISAKVSAYFWSSRGLNELSDQGNFREITRRINAALKGYNERLEFWNKAKKTILPKEASLTPNYLGDVGDSGVFRIDLSTSGLCSIQSITIEDDNVISGGTGAASGFDLDMIKLSPVLTSSAFQASSLVDSNAFTFSDLTTSFQPGFLQPWQSSDPEIWNQDRLFGTAGLGINFSNATLNSIDAENSAEFGSISIGEGGKITFILNTPISSTGLYLYVADAGGGNDNFRVRVSSVSNPTSQQGLTLAGTSSDDVIDLVQGFNGLVGRGNDNISGGDGNDRILTAAGNDVVNGDAGDDVLDGGQGNDKVFGGEGSDYLLGQVGNDQLAGGSGIDALDGGQGNNKLTGGIDRDIFVLSRGKGKSVVQDFRPSQDVLGLSKGMRSSNLDIVQKGRNVLVSRGSDQLALLLGVQTGQIGDSNFVKV